jgi:PhzF family phenazine biosynthesis protein
MEAVEVVQVDAFATEPFKGNPAAVCFLPVSSSTGSCVWPSNQWLQDLAAEMNLSETAFLLPTTAPTSSHAGMRPSPSSSPSSLPHLR